MGAHLRLDHDYFNRMDALAYAISHDDGHATQDLEAADVVLVGVPWCRAANRRRSSSS